MPTKDFNIQKARTQYLADYQKIVTSLDQSSEGLLSASVVLSDSALGADYKFVILSNILAKIADRVKEEVSRRFCYFTDEEKENFYQALHTSKLKSLIYDTYQAAKLNASDDIYNASPRPTLENKLISIAENKFEKIVDQEFEALNKPEYTIPAIDYSLPKKAKLSNSSELSNTQILIKKCLKEFLEDNEGQILENLNLTENPANVTDILKALIQLEEEKKVIENVRSLNSSNSI